MWRKSTRPATATVGRLQAIRGVPAPLWFQTGTLTQYPKSKGSSFAGHRHADGVAASLSDRKRF
jgi:hypothetical protein